MRRKEEGRRRGKKNGPRVERVCKKVYGYGNGTGTNRQQRAVILDF